MSTKTTVSIVQNILSANDRIAAQNRALLDQNHLFSINIMASPGSGKTSFIIRTIQQMAGQIRIGVVEGDTAPVTIDADKVTAAGVTSTQATQINTGGDCHLDAIMLSQGLSSLDLSCLDLIVVENVGNLVCPAAFNLGTHKNILVASIPEGDDKPYKYPAMYQAVDVLILNKMDLLPYVDFDLEYYLAGVRMLNPDLVHFSVSCRTGDGISTWIEWLTAQIESR